MFGTVEFPVIEKKYALHTSCTSTNIPYFYVAQPRAQCVHIYVSVLLCRWVVVPSDLVVLVKSTERIYLVRALVRSTRTCAQTIYTSGISASPFSISPLIGSPSCRPPHAPCHFGAHR